MYLLLWRTYLVFFFQAVPGLRHLVRSRAIGVVYKTKAHFDGLHERAAARAGRVHVLARDDQRHAHAALGRTIILRRRRTCPWHSRGPHVPTTNEA